MATIDAGWVVDEANQPFFARLADLLAPLADELAGKAPPPSAPPVFIVGPPRSGTTMVYQLIARGLEVGYVSNVMARFWTAPVLGAMVSRRALGLSAPEDLESDLGRTASPGGVHEFGYFWRRFFDDTLTDWADEPLRGMGEPLQRELAGIAAVFARRLVFKNLTCSQRIVPLSRLLPGCVFIDIRRDRLDTAASILLGRRRCLDDISQWWSLRPKEVDEFRGLAVIEQIAAQMDSTWSRIEADCAAMGAERIELAYEDCCRAPDDMLEMLAGRLGVERRAWTPSPVAVRRARLDDEPLAGELRRVFG